MKNTAKIFLATYFVVLSVLYLTGRYTTFEMHPLAFAAASIILLLLIWITIYHGQIRGAGWAMLILTALMLMSYLFSQAG